MQQNVLILMSFRKKNFFINVEGDQKCLCFKTHIIGTGRRSDVEKDIAGQRFTVILWWLIKSENHPDPVLNCIFDENKPFHRELKKMIDVYYNSIFTNFLIVQP